MANITIPSVFERGDFELITNAKYQWNDMNRNIMNDTHPLTQFAIVGGICYLIILSFMVAKRINDCMHARHCLPMSALKITRYKLEDPHERCVICLEDYLEGDKLHILPCSHAFHCKCIHLWLTSSHGACPMCKREVFALHERVPDDEDGRTGGDEVPQNDATAPQANDESENERAPLMRASTQGRRQGQRESSRRGSTFQTQRLAARRLRGSLPPSVLAPTLIQNSLPYATQSLNEPYVQAETSTQGCCEGHRENSSRGDSFHTCGDGRAARHRRRPPSSTVPARATRPTTEDFSSASAVTSSSESSI